MKTFVINLPKNAERMAKISARLSRLGVSYERVEAVYGRDLTPCEKRRQVDFLHWWCIKGYPPRDGEIGCSLSHFNVYRRMAAENIPVACVLEDDTVMDDRFVEQLRRVESRMHTDAPQVVLLSNYTEQREEDWKILPATRDSSTEAYVLNLAAAKRMIKETKRVFLTADAWSYRVQKGWIELYHAFPTVIIPEWSKDASYTSDVTPDNTIVADVRRMSAVQKIGWKAKRAVGLAIARVVYG